MKEKQNKIIPHLSCRIMACWVLNLSLQPKRNSSLDKMFHVLSCLLTVSPERAHYFIVDIDYSWSWLTRDWWMHYVKYQSQKCSEWIKHKWQVLFVDTEVFEKEASQLAPPWHCASSLGYLSLRPQGQMYRAAAQGSLRNEKVLGKHLLKRTPISLSFFLVHAQSGKIINSVDICHRGHLFSKWSYIRLHLVRKRRKDFQAGKG